MLKPFLLLPEAATSILILLSVSLASLSALTVFLIAITTVNRMFDDLKMETIPQHRSVKID